MAKSNFSLILAKGNMLRYENQAENKC